MKYRSGLAPLMLTLAVSAVSVWGGNPTAYLPPEEHHDPGTGWEVSALGVNYHHNSAGTHALESHVVENDRVVKHIELISENQGNMDDITKFGSMSMNVQGTHVAFFNETSGGDWRISVMRVDAATRQRKDLATIAAGDFHESARLRWPEGPWVWYTKDGRVPEVYRVNVNTGESELLITFDATVMADGDTLKFDAFHMRSVQYDSRWLYGTGLSGYAGILRVPDLSQASLPVVLDHVVPLPTAGCGHVLSPTFKFWSWNSNPSHTNRAYAAVFIEDIDTAVAYDWSNAGGIWNHEMGVFCDRLWNQNPINSPFNYDIQGKINWAGEPMPITIGCAIDEGCNRFAVNSEEWTAVHMYWNTRPTGNYTGGGNLVAFHWMDSLQLREQNNHFDTTGLEMAINVSEYELHKNDSPYIDLSPYLDFWILSPQEHVVEELRQYTTDDVRRNYRIQGLDESITVDSLLPASPVSVKENAVRSTVMNPGARAQVTAYRRNGRVHLSLPFTGIRRVSIFSPAGEKMYSAATADKTHIIPAASLGATVGIVKVRAADGVAVNRVSLIN